MRRSMRRSHVVTARRRTAIVVSVTTPVRRGRSIHRTLAVTVAASFRAAIVISVAWTVN